MKLNESHKVNGTINAGLSSADKQIHTHSKMIRRPNNGAYQN